jgi:hypothetical protein
MEIDNSYGWSTHKPLLKALIDVYKVENIVELGIGLHSTKLFNESTNIKRILSIENDIKWLQLYQKNNLIKSNHIVIYHNLGNDITKQKLPKDLSQHQICRIADYYLNLEYIIRDRFDLLFVDNFAAYRSIAINQLFHRFNIIVYHDSESTDFYQYYFKKDILDNYSKYTLMTDSVTTSCFVKHDKEVELTTNIQDHIDEYCIENNLKRPSVYLIKEN